MMRGMHLPCVLRCVCDVVWCGAGVCLHSQAQGLEYADVKRAKRVAALERKVSPLGWRQVFSWLAVFMGVVLVHQCSVLMVVVVGHKLNHLSPSLARTIACIQTIALAC